MPPLDLSDIDEISLEHLERYCVEGDRALQDPFVARTVTRYESVANHLRPLMGALRAQSQATTEPSLLATMDRLRLSRIAHESRPSRLALSSALSRIRVVTHTVVRSRVWPSIAALCAVILSVVYSTHQRSSDKTPVLSLTPATTYTAKNGQRTTVSLPDGSVAILNVASELTVPDDFGTGHRTLTLQGEALFTVAHDNRKPFVVMSGTTLTRVLGTTFAVRHYRTDTATTVAVRDGKVAVQSVVVAAQWQANVGPTKNITVQPVAPERFAFAEGILALTDLSLPDAIPELARWYDADIRLASPILASHRVTAIFHSGSLTELARILEFSLDVRVERIGRILTLYPRGI